MFGGEVGLQGCEVFGVFAGNVEGLGAEAVREAVTGRRRLPCSVLGPVDFRAFAWLASFCRCVGMRIESPFFSGTASYDLSISLY